MLSQIGDMNFQKFYFNNCMCLNNIYALNVSCSTQLDNDIQTLSLIDLFTTRNSTLNTIKVEILSNLLLIFKETYVSYLLEVINLDLNFNHKCRLIIKSNQFNLSIKQNFNKIIQSNVSFGLQYAIDLFSINNTCVLNFSVLNNSEILMVDLNSSVSVNNRTESIQSSKPDLIGLVAYIVIFVFLAFGFLLIYTFIINKKKNN
jgi:hypothetical protein